MEPNKPEGERMSVRTPSTWVRPRGLGRTLVGLAFATLLVACGGTAPTDSTPRPTTGGLKVDIVGLPTGLAAAVTVEGPGVAQTPLTGSQEFLELEPGSYTLRVDDVTHDIDEYRHSGPGTRTVDVVAGGTVTAKVEYVRTLSSLSLNVTGLAGIDGSIYVTGPEGYEATVTRSVVLGGLVPGTYRIYAVDVDADSFYEPTPTRASVFLAAGSHDEVVGIEYARLEGSIVHVTNDSDDIDAIGSLRYWLAQSELPGSDIARIDFTAAAFATPTGIQLDADLVIGHRIRIVGPTDAQRAPLVTLRAADHSRILTVEPTAEVIVRNLRLTGGAVIGDGGAIVNSGTLSLDNVVVVDNKASYGGGIFNSTGADLQLSHSRVTQNRASSGGGIANLGTLHLVTSQVAENGSTGSGAGILNMNPDSELYVVQGSEVTGNVTTGPAGSGFGGGVHNQAGRVEIDGSAVSTNSAYDGGGLSSMSGTLLVTNASRIEGNSAVNGGGIHNAGDLTLTGNSVVAGNEATSRGGGLYNAAVDGPTGVVTAEVRSSRFEVNESFLGGGIWNGSDLKVGGSVLRGNVAMGGPLDGDPKGSGGGIYNSASGEVDIVDSTVTANESDGFGGGIRNLNLLDLAHSTVGLNSGHEGGGLAITQGGYSNVFNATFADNSASWAGGGIAVLDSAEVWLSDSTVRGNSSRLGGGGISHGSTGLVRVTHSTFTGNVSDSNGGGVFSNGAMGLTNVTIVDNKARRGGGLAVSSGPNVDVDVAFSTISLNQLVEGTGSGNMDGAGIYYAGPLTLRGTVVAGNGDEHASAAGPDIFEHNTGSIVSHGYNVIGNDAGANLPVQDLDRRNVDPLLGALQLNGGRTQTMSLLPGSPAIGLVPVSECSYPSGLRLDRDQREAPRPGPDGTCDAGAYQTR